MEFLMIAVAFVWLACGLLTDKRHQHGKTGRDTRRLEQLEIAERFNDECG